MLGEHNITYRPSTSVKGQILADFLIEKPDENLPKTPAADIPQEPWTLFMDGSSCIDGSGVGLILTSLEGTDTDGSTQCAPLEITCSCFHDFIDKDLIDLVLPDVRRYVVVLTGIYYHLKELRCCAQCLIEDEDFIKRSRSTLGEEVDHYIEPTEFEIQEMGDDYISTSGEALAL
ncbi:hypothetical protein Tco_0732967 [Tanacetum coccineum]